MTESTYSFDGRKIRTIVANSGVIRHEFFKAIMESTPRSKALIRAFATSDYLVAKGFAQFLAHLISLVDNARTRMLLVGNLWDEHGLGNPEEIHFELYKRLIKSLDLDEPRPEVGARAEFLQLHYDIAAESVTNGIAIFTYANEFLSMFEFSKIRGACKVNFPLADERYFETNQKADIVHTEQLEAALTLLITTELQEQEMLKAIDRALKSRQSFYDTLLLTVK